MGSIPGTPKVIFGSFFFNLGMSWDVSGSGLGTFSGWVWDGFGKKLDGSKIEIFKNGREYFSGVGALKINMFRLSRTKF